MQHFPLTEKLHTDVLEEKYGIINSKVLKHDNKIREALLVDDKGIARTYAITFISSDLSGEIKKINEEIKSGKPIGKAFREKGYIIRKNVLDVFIINIPLWLKKEFQTDENKAKARLSEFYAKKSDSDPIIYGIVTEVYAPDFRKAVVNEVDKSQIGPTTFFLEKEGLPKQEIWARIGNENNYDDILKIFKSAKKKSNSTIKKLRSRIEKEIKSPQ